ncbi:MAG TPA: PEP-CTERM sorting domain-containing protein [Bryobacteraceae bacterium]|nr:PEP-CTERM sorting domain-containing protein [Bryobacteraceae bacterium]
MKQSSRKPLEAQLASYFATVETSAWAPRDWTRKWPGHATVVGAALALGTSLVADTIVYSGIQNVTLTNSNGTSQKGININGASFQLMLRHDGFTNAASLNGAAVHTSANFVAKLASGAVISSGIGFIGGAHILRGQVFLAGTQGNFLTGQTGIAAIQAGSDLGWIRLRVDATGGNPISVTAIDWAYDTAGESIVAGDTGLAAPEPGTTAMALLAAGAAGVLAWRRRKTQSDA